MSSEPLTAAQRDTLADVEITMTDLTAFLTPLLIKEAGKDTNLKSVLRVAAKLISGEGVTHKAKPGEAFFVGTPITLDMDIEQIRRTAAEWLPYEKKHGELCLDKGHGWALNHPLKKLIAFQQHVYYERAHGSATAVIPSSIADEHSSKVEFGVKTEVDEDIRVADLADVNESPAPPTRLVDLPAPSNFIASPASPQRMESRTMSDGEATPGWLTGAQSVLNQLDTNRKVPPPCVPTTNHHAVPLPCLDEMSAKQLAELARRKRQEEAEARAAEKLAKQREKEEEAEARAAEKLAKQREKERLAEEKAAREAEKRRLAAEKAAAAAEKAEAVRAAAVQKAAAAKGHVYILSAMYDGDASSSSWTVKHRCHGAFPTKQLALESVGAVAGEYLRDGAWQSELPSIESPPRIQGDSGVAFFVRECDRWLTVRVDKQMLLDSPLSCATRQTDETLPAVTDDGTRDGACAPPASPTPSASVCEI